MLNKFYFNLVALPFVLLSLTSVSARAADTDLLDINWTKDFRAYHSADIGIGISESKFTKLIYDTKATPTKLITYDHKALGNTKIGKIGIQFSDDRAAKVLIDTIDYLQEAQIRGSACSFLFQTPKLSESDLLAELQKTVPKTQYKRSLLVTDKIPDTLFIEQFAKEIIGIAQKGSAQLVQTGLMHLLLEGLPMSTIPGQSASMAESIVNKLAYIAGKNAARTLLQPDQILDGLLGKRNSVFSAVSNKKVSSEATELLALIYDRSLVDGPIKDLFARAIEARRSQIADSLGRHAPTSLVVTLPSVQELLTNFQTSTGKKCPVLGTHDQKRSGRTYEAPDLNAGTSTPPSQTPPPTHPQIEETKRPSGLNTALGPTNPGTDPTTPITPDTGSTHLINTNEPVDITDGTASGSSSAPALTTTTSSSTSSSASSSSSSSSSSSASSPALSSTSTPVLTTTPVPTRPIGSPALSPGLETKRIALPPNAAVSAEEMTNEGKIQQNYFNLLTSSLHDGRLAPKIRLANLMKLYLWRKTPNFYTTNIRQLSEGPQSLADLDKRDEKGERLLDLALQANDYHSVIGIIKYYRKYGGTVPSDSKRPDLLAQIPQPLPEPLERREYPHSVTDGYFAVARSGSMRYQAMQAGQENASYLLSDLRKASLPHITAPVPDQETDTDQRDVSEIIQDSISSKINPQLLDAVAKRDQHEVVKALASIPTRLVRIDLGLMKYVQADPSKEARYEAEKNIFDTLTMADDAIVSSQRKAESDSSKEETKAPAKNQTETQEKSNSATARTGLFSGALGYGKSAMGAMSSAMSWFKKAPPEQKASTGENPTATGASSSSASSSSTPPPVQALADTVDPAIEAKRKAEFERERAALYQAVSQRNVEEVGQKIGWFINSRIPTGIDLKSLNYIIDQVEAEMEIGELLEKHNAAVQRQAELQQLQKAVDSAEAAHDSEFVFVGSPPSLPNGRSPNNSPIISPPALRSVSSPAGSPALGPLPRSVVSPPSANNSSRSSTGSASPAISGVDNSDGENEFVDVELGQ